MGVDKAEKTEEQSDPHWDDQWKVALETALKGLLKKHDSQKEKSKTDADFAIAVHQALGQLPRRIAGLEGFWHWLTLSSDVCEKYTRWRWANLEKTTGTKSTSTGGEIGESISNASETTEKPVVLNDENEKEVLDQTNEEMSTKMSTKDSDDAASNKSANASATPTHTDRYLVPKARFVGSGRRNALSRLWWAAEVTCDHTVKGSTESDLKTRYDYTCRGLADSDVMQYIVDVEAFSFAHANGKVTDNRLWHMLIDEFEKKRIETGTDEYVTDIPTGQKATHKMSGKGFVAMASQLGMLMVTTEFTMLDASSIQSLVQQAAVDGIKYTKENGGNNPIKDIK